MTLTEQSFTRVTLALDIVRKIPDGPFAGYHELGTIKHLIDLHDTLTIEEADSDRVSCNDPGVPADGRNICLKVADLVRREFAINSRVAVTIEKRIPVMGGLAGGSANAATMLSLLNRLWKLGLDTPALIALGRRAGMDVPYYFAGTTSFDSEAGGRLEAISTGCTFDFVLACPEFGVSTADAYRGIDYGAIGLDRQKTAALRAALESEDRISALKLVHNDFERTVFAAHPRLAAIRRELLDAGCVAALMTGSGSTVIGIANDRNQAEEIGRKVSCRTIVARTKDGMLKG